MSGEGGDDGGLAVSGGKGGNVQGLGQAVLLGVGQADRSGWVIIA